MVKDPGFLFYPGDYLRDTQTLSEKAQVAYDRIMCEHMRNICISKKQLKFFIKRLDQDEIDSLMYVLNEINGGFQIEWVAESILKRKAYSESRRNNRLSGVDKDMSNISKTYVGHMEDEDENENENDIKGEKSQEKGGILFNNFWVIYDKKINKKGCEKKWNNLKVKNQEKIIKTLPIWLSQFKEKQFQPYPLTYLNQERWNDEIPEIGKKSNKPQPPDMTGIPMTQASIIAYKEKWGVYPKQNLKFDYKKPDKSIRLGKLEVVKDIFKVDPNQ